MEGGREGGRREGEEGGRERREGGGREEKRDAISTLLLEVDDTIYTPKTTYLLTVLNTTNSTMSKYDGIHVFRELLHRAPPHPAPGHERLEQ